MNNWFDISKTNLITNETSEELLLRQQKSLKEIDLFYENKNLQLQKKIKNQEAYQKRKKQKEEKDINDGKIKQKQNKRKKDNQILRTKKYKILFNNNEQKIINSWLDDYLLLYNETINFLKPKINKDNYYTKEIISLLDWINLRDSYMNDMIHQISEKNNMPNNSLRMAVQDACAMFKSAISNYENKVEKRLTVFGYYDDDNNLSDEMKQIKKEKYKPIKFPNMKLMKLNKNRKVMVIPIQYLTTNNEKSGIFPSTFKNYNMKVFNSYDKIKCNCKKNCICKNIYKCDCKLKKKCNCKYNFKLNKTTINHDFKLQYNNKTKEYHLLIPYDKEKKIISNREKKCAIDLGVRTFATSIDINNIITEVANNDKIKQNIIPHFKKIDRANYLKYNKFINKSKYKKILDLNYQKIKNKIKELKYKTAIYYCSNYDIIHIGKISTSSIKKSPTTDKMTKRLLNQLSFYQLIETFKHKGEEYNCDIILINEWRTTKQCSNCQNIKNDVGSNKIYNCNNCNLVIDRDVNASRNIYDRKK
jgi:transposase